MKKTALFGKQSWIGIKLRKCVTSRPSDPIQTLRTHMIMIARYARLKEL
jgi:hypothetical protein